MEQGFLFGKWLQSFAADNEQTFVKLGVEEKASARDYDGDSNKTFAVKSSPKFSGPMLGGSWLTRTSQFSL